MMMRLSTALLLLGTGSAAPINRRALDEVTAVELGTAGGFVILTKAGISTVPTSAITGNIGVSPAAATYMTGRLGHGDRLHRTRRRAPPPTTRSST
jgi:hypothetical protein